MARKVVILAAGAGTRLSTWKSDVPKPLVRLCGLPLIERAIRSAHRAGFDQFTVITGYRSDDVVRALGDGSGLGVRIEFVHNAEWQKSNGLSLLKAKDAVRDDFVLLMSDHVTEVSTYERVAKLSLGSDDLVLLTDPRIDDVFDLDDATKVNLAGDRIADIGKEIPSYNTIDTGIFLCTPRIFDVLEKIRSEKGDASLSDAVRDLARVGKARGENFGSGWWQDVDSRSAFRHAEKLLLQSQRKPTDVWVSRHLNRPISLFLSKYLSRFAVRPDVISFVSMIVGFMAPLFLIQGGYWNFVWGAFCYHFSSVLDGCDGEVARLKFMESKHGEWIDTLSDTATHILFVAGLVIGMYGQTRSPFIWVLAGLSVTGIGSLLWVMFHYLVKVADRGSLIAFEQDYTRAVNGARDFSTVLAKMLKPLIRRATFAFMFFALAVLGHLEIVLYLVAFGTNLATLLVFLTLKRRARALVPEASIQRR